MPLRLACYILALAALLSGCAGAPAPSAPTAAGQAPTPSAAPVAPTAAPAGSPSGSIATATPGPPPLPAPLYALERGQIARIERDGLTRAQLTRERIEVEGYPPISAFDVGPQGDLVYVVGDLEADRLVRAGPRGEGPTTIYEEPGHELSDLLWSPDGEFVYLRMLNNKEPPDIPSGLYRLAAAGGALEPVRADDPVDDPVNPARTVSGYRPFAFSPDGARLLVEVFSLFYEGCGLATMLAGGGDPAGLSVPDGVQVYCGEASWAPDSSAVAFLAGPPADAAGAGPTLWRAPAEGGPAEELGGQQALARAPKIMPGGAVRFFLVRLIDPAAGTASFAPAEIAGPGAAPAELGQPFSDLLSRALWAPDGSGVAVAVVPEVEARALRWLPVGGQPLELPTTQDDVGGLRWGVE